jgi:DNA-directed RNA polymerase specialized sigma24 family protein
VLNVPEGTVKSQTARALDRLQSVLAEPESIERNHRDH